MLSNITGRELARAVAEAAFLGLIGWLALAVLFALAPARPPANLIPQGNNNCLQAILDRGAGGHIIGIRREPGPCDGGER